MDKKKKGLILSVIGLLGLIIITVGVTYAFFSYVKEGATENAVTTGTITFLYTEVDKAGAGISIENAFPIDDTTGKVQTGAKNVFNFKVEANNGGKSAISYEVTARKSSDSTLVEEAVKLYLTEVTGDSEKELLLDNYNNLDDTNVDIPTGTVEKTIYTGKVASNTTDYKKEFRLRMWIDDEINFSPTKDEAGNDVYPYNGKKFAVTVNVYANAKVVTDSDIALESNTNISSLSVNDNVLTSVEGKKYQYETTLPEGTTSTTINIETENPYATVNVERIDSLTSVSNNKTYSVQRLSATKTLQLINGVNYFKVIVTSVNEEVENEFILKISVGATCDAYEVGQIWNYEYTTEEAKEFVAQCSGTYKLEVWGAQGGSTNSSSIGGRGGYSKGYYHLEKDNKLFVYVGEKGVTNTTNDNGGWNGGGNGIKGTQNKPAGGGGGATDIRLIAGDWNDLDGLNSRIIVAGGGGGAGYYGYSNSFSYGGGAGGGLTGVNGNVDANTNNLSGLGGTQEAGGTSVGAKTFSTPGEFGYGGNGCSTGSSSGGGGGGYYGGSGSCAGGGGGGSGYIGGVSGYNGDDAITLSGLEEFPSYTDSGTTIGNQENGHARITYMGK